MSKYIQQYIKICKVCQTCKHGQNASLDLLQPLLIPSLIWIGISMDFIEGFPTSIKKQVIFVVMDKPSKYVNFASMSHPFTAANVA